MLRILRMLNVALVNPNHMLILRRKDYSLSTMESIISPAKIANRFETLLDKHHIDLSRLPTTIMQLNLGKLCNQTCQHCHVEAGPTRKELMTKKTMERLIALAANTPGIQMADLTGGAPEMNPHFRFLVEEIRALNKGVIVRCNLTILEEKGYEWAAPFFVKHQVQVVSSLPCYTPESVNKQRGKGVYDKSITALLKLNALGYASPKHPNLQLNLVYNPLGAFLPADQKNLEAEYKRELSARFGIQFNQLFTITNLPVGRFERTLKKKREYLPYLSLLTKAFNPDSANYVMCRNTLNVSWDGKIYDCDFNQMLDMELDGGRVSIFDDDFSLDSLLCAKISTGDHCLGCTAGAGSSCGGSLT